MNDEFLMDAYKLADFLLDKDEKISKHARNVLAALLEEWVFDFVPVGEKPSPEHHHNAVLIAKSFAVGYKVGVKEK